MLPCFCCCTTPVFHLAITGLSHKFSSVKDMFYNNHIKQLISLSFNHFFLYIFYIFLMTPINVVILYPTIVIIHFFIFELLLFTPRTVVVQLLLSNWNCLEIKPLMSRHWTVTVFKCYCLQRSHSDLYSNF
jgi:hypothetical protein